MTRWLAFLLVCASLSALPACGTIGSSEGMTRVASVAPGSSFVRAVRDSGSYGSNTSTVTVTRLPNRGWNGRTVGVWQPSAGPTLLLDPSDGAFVALVNGEQPVISYEPALGWPWPLEVGKSWTRQSTMVVHASRQRVPVEQRSTVEAYEDTVLPAGTFKAWRVRTVDNLGNDDLQWFSTDLTVFLKQRLTRTAAHAAGPGVRETELLSQAIRHQ